MDNQIGINWRVSSHTGWGVLGVNLCLELINSWDMQPVLLQKVGKISLSEADKGIMSQCIHAYDLDNEKSELAEYQFPIFHACGNNFVSPDKVESFKENRAIIFFENTFFNPGSKKTASMFSRIYAGSKWNSEILKARGFKNVVHWTQGVDSGLFSPVGEKCPRDDRFRIFSGGKFEFRKGQDIVVEAFKQFHHKYKDSVLVFAWLSPWHKLVESMSQSPYVSVPEVSPKLAKNINSWLISEGLSSDSFINLGFIPNFKLPGRLRSCDVALFPNRAEGGTNLAAMEAISCGVPAILSNNTGHQDLINNIPCFALEKQQSVETDKKHYGTEGWGESSIDEIVFCLEEAYHDRDRARKIGQAGSEAIRRWSWNHSVSELVEVLD